MASTTTDMLTAGKIAQALSAPGPRVKKAMQELGIKPVAKKGGCSYYPKEVIAKIKPLLRKG